MGRWFCRREVPILLIARAKDPEAAAGFLEFLASDEEMKQFCIDAQFIPVRTSLVQEGLDYKLRPEDMGVFVNQSETVPETMAREQTFPDFNKVNQVLADELEAAFKTGQTPEDTAKNIESGSRKPWVKASSCKVARRLGHAARKDLA